MTNVVLVSIDCLRDDRVYSHHRYTTPVLHELRNNAIVFNSAYATGSYTTESIPGLIAGQHSYNGVHYGDDVTWKAIPESPTLASWLQDHGYETTATLTNPHLSQSRNFDRGFDRFQNLRLEEDSTVKEGEDEKGNKLQFGSLLYKVRSRMRQYNTTFNPYTLPVMMYRYSQSITEWPTVSGEEVIDSFKREINGKDGDIFAWAHLMDLHAPLRPSSVRSGGLSAVNNTFSQIKADVARAACIHEPRYDTMYDSALRYVDNQIGDLINHLKKIGEWNDTMLIITGDHGEVLFDRKNVYTHPPHHLYDELLHVPLIVSMPEGASTQSTQIDSPVSLAWIHELIAEVCGIEQGDFPAKSGKLSLLDSGEMKHPIISDAINSEGHTIAVRNEEEKLIHHNPNEKIQIDYDYATNDVQFSYRDDPRERLPMTDGLSKELGDIAKKYATTPEKIPNIEGGFSQSVEDRLQDLGYKM